MLLCIGVSDRTNFFNDRVSNHLLILHQLLRRTNDRRLKTYASTDLFNFPADLGVGNAPWPCS